MFIKLWVIPISIWEAMSMNLPIISTKVGDLTRVIINGQNGYIIEKHNTFFFKKIHQLLIDKKLLQIGANRSNSKLYDVNIIANKTFQF